MEKTAAHTYCNPLSIPMIPRGKDDWYPFEKEMFSHENKPASVTGPDYRSISDPTVFYHDNKWYLYPSYGMAWVTEDFEHWKHVRTEPYCPKYSPSITRWKDRFLLVSWNNPLYVAADPLGPFELLGKFIGLDGETFVPCDPCIFTNDDGRIYMYAFLDEPIPGKSYHCSTIVGYELDTEDPRRVVRGPELILKMNPRDNWWERNGFYGEDTSFCWVEGPHLLKHNGRYYMIYASPDTCNSAYVQGVYYSDKGPLEGFVQQKKNPLTFHREGIVAGAGHGCVEHGPNNTLWAFYTIATPSAHCFERRIGMDLVAVDENGELYCPHGVTDTPQYIPGFVADPVGDGNSPGYLPIAKRWRPTATSALPGRDSIYATDESPITWWEPDPADPLPTLTNNLKVPFLLGASRVFWHESGLDYDKGHVPGPISYLIEGSIHNGPWFPLVDCRDAKEDLNIDYRSFTPKTCDKVRITITGAPAGIHPGVIDFTVFGVRDDR